METKSICNECGQMSRSKITCDECGEIMNQGIAITVEFSYPHELDGLTVHFCCTAHAADYFKKEMEKTQ